MFCLNFQHQQQLFDFFSSAKKSYLFIQVQTNNIYEYIQQYNKAVNYNNKQSIMSDPYQTLKQASGIFLIKNPKKLYIYAQVDIDKAYTEICSKSKKIQKYVQSNKLDFDFQQKIRNYKNFRICFDNQIQKFIYNKELNPDLRLFKKNVFAALEDFIIQRYAIFLQDQLLHQEYKAKVQEVQIKFIKRMQQLMKSIEQ